LFLFLLFFLRCALLLIVVAGRPQHLGRAIRRGRLGFFFAPSGASGPDEKAAEAASTDAAAPSGAEAAELDFVAEEDATGLDAAVVAAIVALPFPFFAPDVALSSSSGCHTSVKIGFGVR
jgi:hypothetical protein